MSAKLEVKGRRVVGEISLTIAPGTPAAECDKAVHDALLEPLSAAAQELGAVLSASPRKYARPLPGKDEHGKSHYAVAGRLEGGRLVPDLDAASRR